MLFVTVGSVIVLGLISYFFNNNIVDKNFDQLIITDACFYDNSMNPDDYFFNDEKPEDEGQVENEVHEVNEDQVENEVHEGNEYFHIINP